MQTSNMKEFGEKVKAYLHGKRITLQNFAKFIPLDYSTLSKFLNGKYDTPEAFVHIQNIVKALADKKIIENRGQAIDLLDILGCPHFSDNDWSASPLNKLKLVPSKERDPSVFMESDASISPTYSISSEKRKALETFSQNYRNSLKRDAQIAYLQIPGMRHPLTLSKTYVQLRVHEGSRTYSFSSAMLGEGPEEMIERDRRFLNKKVEKALAPDKVIQEKSRCIILGNPGSGKTSLLKYLTLASANKEFKDLPDLPIYIKLNEFVESACSTLLEFAAIDWNMRCGISNADAVVYLEDKMREGKIIMLLDALDETKIGTTTQEANNSYLRAVRAIQDLTKMSSKTPIVVTMRKTNLPDTSLTGFWHFDILDLRREDIYQFVENWRKDQPDSLTQFDITDIKSKLERNPRIMALAANPLMLSLILLTYKDHFKEISERRAKLFERCVNLLLNEWGVKNSAKRADRLDMGQKKQMLQFIAWHFHARGQREFTEEELLSAITKFFGEHQLTKYQILEEISNEDGCIKKIAYGVYSFLHLTLQEYFVAKHIANSGQLDFLISQRGNAWWDEIFLLYIDCINEPIILLNKLLDIDNATPFEDLFYTNLVLAGCCLSIRPDLQESEIYQQITHRLFDAFLNARPDLATKERIVYALVKIGGEEVIDQLLALLYDPNVNHHLYDLIVYAFDRHLHDRSMAHKLVQLLKVQHIKYDPLRNIPWVLAKIGERSVIPEMIKLLSDTQIHNYVRGEIGDALGTLGDQSIIPFLLEVLNNSLLDEYVAQWTARSVAALCDTSYLLPLLPTITNLWTKWGVADILLNAFEEQADYSVAKRLLSLVYDLRFSLDMTGTITLIIGRIRSCLLSHTIQLINMILWIDQLSIIRSRQIIESLSRMEKCRIGNELLSLFSDAQLDDVLRWECVKTLGIIGEKRAVPILLGILLDAQDDEEIRQCAAESIGYLEDTSILPQLFALLSDDAIAVDTRKRIACSIGKLGERSVVDRFLSLIADECLHPDVRCSIISVIEDIYEKHSLIPKLEQILEMEHLDPVVRQYADRTLSSLKVAVSSHNVQSSQNQAYSKKEKTNYTVSDERKFTEAKAEIVELVQSLRKTDTSCFTKLRGYPKDHQGYVIESKIERANDIYYKLWEMSQQIGVRIFVVNTSAGSEVKLTKWGTLEE